MRISFSTYSHFSFIASCQFFLLFLLLPPKSFYRLVESSYETSVERFFPRGSVSILTLHVEQILEYNLSKTTVVVNWNSVQEITNGK